ncbi:adenosylcobalamin-dependent ribonucleoside-diphosphate reductase [Candidatus Woesearchaeota archaeon]|nr:adenosylcobalamin-dependent ribonucleoside-diphosphate reductase [Candidatus Woesearchaeota archaeon]
MATCHIRHVKKRDDGIVPFNADNIKRAIASAFEAAMSSNLEAIPQLVDKVIENLNARFSADTVPSVEQIQDVVEQTLMQQEFFDVAKTYILYREKRTEVRELKSRIIGRQDDSKLTVNALRVAQEKYLQTFKDGTIETPKEMFRRVAACVAAAELIYDQKFDVHSLRDAFFQAMCNLEFLPGGRTLANAASKSNQLVNCFVLPIEDELSSIYDTLKEAATIQKFGGGTGFCFSKLRPKNEPVSNHEGTSSGPVSFLELFDMSTEIIKKGGERRGANMGVLRVDHPDILEFVTIKDQGNKLTNFNISVGLTNEFMDAVLDDDDYSLVNPASGGVCKRMRARKIFDLLVAMAWRKGDPGVLFIDTINNKNPTPSLGRLNTTSACGEVPLLAYEACNLGSINLARFVNGKTLNWERLRDVTRLAVRFLDNVIDVTSYPLEKIDEVAKSNRKIGLGIMGFADMLYQLRIPYNSDAAITIAEQVMSFITEEAQKTSEKLAQERGPFPNYHKSVFHGKRVLRNATLTAIAPTGSLSMIAETSGGVEPNFALGYIRRALDGKEFTCLNRYFEEVARHQGFYSQELMDHICRGGAIHAREDVPEEIKTVFVIAHDISPYWHLKIQATFQKFVDNSISKTVNFPNNATPKDVEEVYLLAYKWGCKGVTIYRNGSLSNQVIDVSDNAPAELEHQKDEESRLAQEAIKSGKGITPGVQKSLLMIETPNKDN